MNSDSSLKSCLTLTGGILGILVALITVIKFLFPKAQDFPAFMSNVWPGLASSLQTIGNAIYRFAASSPVTPWWTAILVIVIGATIAHAMELGFSLDWWKLPILALPALIWIFIFSGIASAFGIIVFLLGYFLIALAVGFFFD